MRIKLSTLRERGDTIVEVLIAIAVASAVMGSAFVLVNRTSRNVRQSQEHAEALKLVEGQLELLKERIKSGDSNPAGGADFCFDAASATPLTPVTPASDARCQVAPGPGSLYQYALKLHRHPAPDPRGGLQYVISADWDSVVSGRDHVDVVYKVYP
jgi:type II secretory pathway pseudopilin PulG